MAFGSGELEHARRADLRRARRDDHVDGAAAVEPVAGGGICERTTPFGSGAAWLTTWRARPSCCAVADRGGLHEPDEARRRVARRADLRERGGAERGRDRERGEHGERHHAPLAGALLGRAGREAEAAADRAGRADRREVGWPTDRLVARPDRTGRGSTRARPVVAVDRLGRMRIGRVGDARQHERLRTRQGLDDVGERGLHRRRVGIAVVGIDLAGTLDDGLQRAHLGRRDDRPLRARRERADRGVGAERDAGRSPPPRAPTRASTDRNASSCTPRACSGDAYRAVPNTAPAGSVHDASASARARSRRCARRRARRRAGWPA